MTTFSRAGRLTQGYDCDQVDEFFARARESYELVGVSGAAGSVSGPVPGSGSGSASGADDRAGRRRALTAREVRVVAFDLVRGGYDVRQVDAALDRLEDAVARRERESVVGTLGEQALLDQLTRRARTLHGRLTRPDGERFARATGFDVAYDVHDVDELCGRLLGYFDDGDEMSADEVRRAVFRTRRGSRGYREAEVDAFLDRAVEIMVSVD